MPVLRKSKASTLTEEPEPMGNDADIELDSAFVGALENFMRRTQHHLKMREARESQQFQEGAVLELYAEENDAADIRETMSRDCDSRKGNMRGQWHAPSKPQNLSEVLSSRLEEIEVAKIFDVTSSLYD